MHIIQCYCPKANEDSIQRAKEYLSPNSRLSVYAKVFALAIAKAKSLEISQLFSKYVTLLIDGEMDIHRGYMGKFAVSRKELDATPRSLDNLSYTSYMLRVAYEEGEAEILAAILSCAYSYEVIAKKILKNNPSAIEHPFYGDWIRGYSSPEYGEANVLLLNTLNRLTARYDEKQLNTSRISLSLALAMNWLFGICLGAWIPNLMVMGSKS